MIDFIANQEGCVSAQEPRIEGVNTIPIDQWTLLPKPRDLKAESDTQFRFFNDDRPLGQDQSYYSVNNALSGPANPRTRTPCPVIAPPSAWDYWSQDFCVPSQINDKTHTELIQSGYISTSQCGNTNGMVIHPSPQPQESPLVSRLTPGMYARPQNDIVYKPIQYSQETPVEKGPIVEGFNTLYPQPYLEVNTKDGPRWVNEKGIEGDIISYTYNPKQMLEHNIPSNMPAGECSRQSQLNEYNKNLFTKVIQPGMYSRQEVIEPIQSNMGITFQQQFEPVSCESDGKGGTVYVTRDPRIIPPMTAIPKPPTIPENSNIYDPRSGGYGTSYRSYVDTMTGRVRYFYDDIDAIRKPNYIGRNNIDDAPWAHSYGTMTNEKTYGPVPNMFSHALANNKFMQDTISERTQLQERYMHKYNNQIAWQRRLAPIHTLGSKFKS